MDPVPWCDVIDAKVIANLACDRHMRTCALRTIMAASAAKTFARNAPAKLEGTLMTPLQQRCLAALSILYLVTICSATSTSEMSQLGQGPKASPGAKLVCTTSDRFSVTADECSPRRGALRNAASRGGL